MSDDGKFQLKGSNLAITAPFELDDRTAGEEAFLTWVDKLMQCRGKTVSIDLVRAGSLSSTVIALCIAAGRKAADKGKDLKLVIAKRNAMAIQVSGLDKLLDIELL